jgi:hypothetical protein
VGHAWLPAAQQEAPPAPKQGRADQAGRAAGQNPVNSVTMPDGTMLHLGEPEPTETTKNPWLADLNKVKQQ